MATFFLVRDHQSEPLVVAHLDDEWRFWEWAPPTGQFHLADWLIDDYFSATPSLTYEELGLQGARVWIDKGIGKSQARFAQRFLRDIEADRFLSTEDLFGGHVVPDESPRERVQRKASEARERPGWIEYQTYAESQRANAYAAANQIRAGRIKGLPADEFDAKSHRAQDGQYVVFIRHTPDGDDRRGVPLTDREREVLGLVASGMSDQQVAARLTITEKTVRNHVGRVISKLHVSGREQAVRYAASRGFARSH